MSLIEKIDSMDIAPFLTVDMNTGYQACIRDIKQIILSEQKEPFTDSKICPKCKRIMSYDSYFKKMVCRQCGNMEATDFR